MKMSIKLLTVMLVAALFSVTTALAEPIGAGEVEPITSSRYNDSVTPGSTDAQAGNLTQLQLNSTGVTRTWQGFYGNITGTLILADSAGNNFYDWNVSTPSGQVYASRNDTISWTGVDCIDPATITAEESYLGKDATDPDSITNTFTATNHPSFFIGSSETTSCPSTQAYGDGGSQDSEFWQVLLQDTSSNTIYTTIIEEAVTQGFNNLPWHFQLLVGENGQPGNEAPTPYYFYVELN